MTSRSVEDADASSADDEGRTSPAVGLTNGDLCHHFQSKAAILLGICELAALAAASVCDDEPPMQTAEKALQDVTVRLVHEIVRTSFMSV